MMSLICYHTGIAICLSAGGFFNSYRYLTIMSTALWARPSLFKQIGLTKLGRYLVAFSRNTLEVVPKVIQTNAFGHLLAFRHFCTVFEPRWSTITELSIEGRIPAMCLRLVMLPVPVLLISHSRQLAHSPIRCAMLPFSPSKESISHIALACQ